MGSCLFLRRCFTVGENVGSLFYPGKMLPFKRGKGRDTGASAGVMDMGWEGGGSSTAHCSCAKAKGVGDKEGLRI